MSDRCALALDLVRGVGKPWQARGGCNLAFLLVLSLLFASVLPDSPAAQPPLYGMNYLFYGVDTWRIPQCKGDRNATTYGKEFLSRYDDPTVRQQVNQQLQEMRRSGFQDIRTILLFGRLTSRPANWFDIDRDAKKAATAVRAYAEDLASAGFREFELAFGPMATLKALLSAGPGKQWGVCYDAGSLPTTSKFITAVRQGLGRTPLSLRIDITNELCLARDASNAANPDAVFLVALLRSYPQAFASDKLTASCSLPRFASAHGLIDEAFAAANRKPDFYELHAYDTGKQELIPILERTRQSLAGAAQPTVLGEVTFGDGAFLGALTKNLPRVRVVDFWPLAHFDSGCGIDTAPPYLLPSAVGLK